MKQFILKIPENTSFDNLSDEVQVAIQVVSGQFPKGVVVGSEAVSGYEIKLVLANATTALLESQFSALSLDWEVLAEEGEVITQDAILDFMSDIPAFDEDGEIIGSTPLADLSSLQTYAGKSWTL